ncbi:MAG TPA: HAMP domain-containing sensor histidine kinase [Thermoanaerobaculia bacterium]
MRTNRLLAVPLLLLAVALAVIGTLQYRWLDRVAEAERQQMRRNLEFVIERLETDLATDIHAVFRTFMGPEDEDVRWLLDDWEQEARHPELVASIFVADRDGDAWTIGRVDPRTRELDATPLPPVLEPLRRALDTLGERGPSERFPGPMFGTIPALFVVQLPPPPDPMTMDRRPRRVLFIHLDRAALGALFAERAQRVAPGLDVELYANRTLVYRSPGAATRPPDAVHEFRPLAPRDRPRPRNVPPRKPSPDETWRLAVSHRGGGLEAIVAAAHRRNLAVAALVLLLLAAASALLVALLRRGERLRAQQAQFVAAMSHELNTPLAILRVASENLHDGIVQDPEKVSRYVRTIARETAHLSEMVNHVLELAGMKAGVAMTGREPVDVGTVIQEAVTQSRWMMTGSEIAMDVDVPPDVPRVLGDPRSLTRAVQNLVTNAIRHAGAGKWVGVRAARDDGFVRIVVEDRGPGIEAEDAGHLFEPFYRGRHSSGIRGTGLGLTIVRQIVTEHGGSIAVERGRPAGAAFVVRLPAEVKS